MSTSRRAQLVAVILVAVCIVVIALYWHHREGERWAPEVRNGFNEIALLVRDWAIDNSASAPAVGLVSREGLSQYISGADSLGPWPTNPHTSKPMKPGSLGITHTQTSRAPMASRLLDTDQVEVQSLSYESPTPVCFRVMMPAVRRLA